MRIFLQQFHDFFAKAGTAAVCIGAVLSCSAAAPQSPPPPRETAEILYIPGWLKNGPHEDLLAIIGGMFPGTVVRLYRWENLHTWKQAVRNADTVSAGLAEELAAMPEKQRKRIILIGHSLGGRICVRVLARLGERGLRIHQAILLGAAIPDDDPDIPKSFRGTTAPILNLCNPDDTTLKYGYGSFGEQMRPPLGANGCRKRHPLCFDIAVPNTVTACTALSDRNRLMNLDTVKRLANHHARFYLEYLRQQLENDFAADSPLMVRQDKVNLEIPVMDRKLFWVEEESCSGWSLQRHKLTGLYRILDPARYRRAWGSYSRMRDSFRKIREQLQHNAEKQSSSVPAQAIPQ